MPSKKEIQKAMEYTPRLDVPVYAVVAAMKSSRDTLAAYVRELVEALRQAGEDIHNIGCAGDMYDEPHSPAHLDIMAVLAKAPKEE
jgi:hypothetical protein